MVREPAYTISPPHPAKKSALPVFHPLPSVADTRIDKLTLNTYTKVRS